MGLHLVPGLSLVLNDRFRRDDFGGTGYLGGDKALLPDGDDGRIRIMNVPARLDITVLEPITHTVVARTWSQPDGTWRVDYLDASRLFTVIGYDRQMRSNSAIQDWVYPAPMEP